MLAAEDQQQMGLVISDGEEMGVLINSDGEEVEIPYIRVRVGSGCGGEETPETDSFEQSENGKVRSLFYQHSRTPGASVHVSRPVEQKPAKTSKRPRYASQIYNDKARAKTRINIGVAFERWRRLREEKAMKSDTQVALYLLDSHEKGLGFSTHHFPPAAPSTESAPLSDQEEKSPVDGDTTADSESTLDAPETLEHMKREEPWPVENASPATASEVLQQQERTITEVEEGGASRELAECCWDSPQQGKTPEDSDDPEYSEKTPKKRCKKDKAEKVLSCEDCNKEFLSVYTRNRHRIKEHGKPPLYKCQDCGRTFKSNRTMMVHRYIYHLPPEQPAEPLDQPRLLKTHQCTTCAKVFPSSGALSRHRIIHSGNKPFKCTLCGRGFTQIGNLKTHQKVHKGEKPISAPLVEQDSSAPEGGEPSVEIHICQVCWTQFSQKSLLEEHIKQEHESSKRYPCPECRRTFTDVEKLQRHQAVHKAPKPHPCSQCDKGFQTSQSLENHMRDHTGEKPFVCNLCGKRFKQVSTLSAHYASHTGEKPHLCFICGKSYGRYEQLKVHLRVHTGERPYQCDECGKSFYYRQGFTAHIKIHNVKPIGPTRRLGRPR